MEGTRVPGVLRLARNSASLPDTLNFRLHWGRVAVSANSDGGLDLFAVVGVMPGRSHCKDYAITRLSMADPDLKMGSQILQIFLVGRLNSVRYLAGGDSNSFQGDGSFEISEEEIGD